MRLPAMLLSLGLASSLAGCATFDKIPPRPGSSRPTGRSAALSVSGGESITMADEVRQSELSGDFRSAAEEGVREAGLFSRVGGQGESADFQVKVDIRRHQGPMYGGLLCLASGFLIPCTIDFRAVVTTSVETESGARRASVVREHTYRAWYELLLFPWWPARSPHQHGVALIKALTQDSLMEALARVQESDAAPSSTPPSAAPVPPTRR